MKYLKIKPYSLKPTESRNLIEGTVYLTTEKRVGFLWLKKEVSTVQMYSTTGILWRPSAHPDSGADFNLSNLVTMYADELLNGETVDLTLEG